MSLLTLSDLRTDLRDLIEEPDNVEPATNTRLNRLLNRAQIDLADCVRKNRTLAGFYATTDTITTTAGTYIDELPSDYISTIKIENTTDGYVLKPESVSKFTDPSDNTNSTANYYGRYGNYIWLFPTPSDTGTTYTHYYKKEPTSMSADTSTPDFPLGFERMLVLAAGLRFGKSMGWDVSDIRAELNEWKLRLRKFRWDGSEPDRVVIASGYMGSQWPNTDGI